MNGLQLEGTIKKVIREGAAADLFSLHQVKFPLKWIRIWQ
jgi:hypothetical protein